MLSLQNKTIEAFEYPFNNLTRPVVYDQIHPQLLEQVKTSAMSKDAVHTSNGSVKRGNSLSNPQPQRPIDHILDSPNNSPDKEKEQTPIEATDAPGCYKYRHTQYHVTNPFRFLYRRFQRLLVRLIIGTNAATLQTAASSLQTFIRLRAVHGWFSHIAPPGDTEFITHDVLNDRISDFLQQNWTVSPWFQDFIRAVIDQKLDADLPGYFANLDPLWDLWDESQRARESNSQLMVVPSLWAGIHVTSFLWGVIAAAIFLVTLAVFLVTLYGLYTLTRRYFGDGGYRSGMSPKHARYLNDVSIGRDTLAIWENAFIDPLPILQKGSKPWCERFNYSVRGASPAKSSEGGASPAIYTSEGVELSKQLVNSSAPGALGVRASGTTEDDHLTVQDNATRLGSIEAVDADCESGSDTSSTDTLRNEEISDIVAEGCGGPTTLRSGSRFSDIWLAEAFVPASDITYSFEPEVDRLRGRDIC
ncbi:hypothetical protein TWF481_009639 [Arthrobotrys musiformis]|uniref:Uncharacterized protein n=1 Tax=Arthrobotrys musiformis TaxID=47236 RepID=A0AAV9W4E5_9PEZI